MLGAQKKIIWAVDPMCEDCSLTRQTAKAVGLLASQWGAEVEPVYVFKNLPSNLEPLPLLLKEIYRDAARRLIDLTKNFLIPRLGQLRVLQVPSKRIKNEVEQLIDYAKNSKADLIVVGTHARKGLERWFLGSFSETLLLRSDVPLFVVNPQERIPKSINHILFATDFSDESKMAFENVIEFAKEMKAKITVYHAVRYEITPWVDTGLAIYPEYSDIFQQEYIARKQDANTWANEAKELGIETDSLVDYQMLGSIPETIVQRAKMREGMIAMAAHSGSFATVFLGSMTRQVVRIARTPVWVIHTSQKSADLRQESRKSA